MESGQIVEQGTHDSLLTAGGAYAWTYAASLPRTGRLVSGVTGRAG
jgi:hypothetical protein